METCKISRVAVVLLIFFQLVFLLHNTAKAQLQQNAQWPFYIAFEDATGAKDTIWLLADTASTWYDMVSGLYGEVPITLDSVNFQVSTEHPAEWDFPFGTWNSYNTLVFPIGNNYPLNAYIEASNYELPIMMSWDSSLFNADVLYEYGDRVNQAYFDNNYFFGLGLDGLGFNFLEDNHVEMPYIGVSHFPLTVRIYRGPYPPLAVAKIDDSEFSIYPNPTNSEILISFSKVTNANLRIYNANGVLVKTGVIHGDQKRIDLKGLSSGLYFVEIKDENGSVVKKVVVKK